MNMEIGNKVSFTYLKEVEIENRNGVTIADYVKNSEAYSGEVVDVREIESSPLAEKTLKYGSIKGERSERLVTVELEDGNAKAFYDGRMIGLSVKKPDVVA
jgi:hypothetical protein